MDWKISRLLAFEDSVNVNRGAAIVVGDVVAVGEQSASSRGDEIGIDGGKFVTRRERHDFLVIARIEAIGHRNESAVGLARLRGHDAFQFGQIVNRRRDRRDAKRGGRGLQRS